MLANTRILLIITGGIAAYKTLDLIRRLRERGASVQCILTKGAENFVTPLSVQTLSENPVLTDLFDLTQENEIGHIRLARDHDLILIAPASAHFIAKMATGQADDLASTLLLATDTPVLTCPAMNPHMWNHKATQRNIKQLQEDGITILEPETGEMAERGEAGKGRLPTTPAIITAAEELLGATKQLQGRRVLITSGPTHEPIDPVRYIANRSSGKQGHAIAEALARAGADVTYITGQTALPTPKGAREIRIESAREMLAAVEGVGKVDIAIFAAAVADWHVVGASDKKIKKQEDKSIPSLELAENPDILQLTAMSKNRPTLVIGFAAETDNLVENAQAKRIRKGADWILANNVSAENDVFGGDQNTIHLITDEGVENWPKMTKTEVAEKLLDQILKS